MTDWTDAYFKRPIDRGEYLCAGHGGKMFICHWWNGSWWRQSMTKRIVGITHWMHLPDRPSFLRRETF